MGTTFLKTQEDANGTRLEISMNMSECGFVYVTGPALEEDKENDEVTTRFILSVKDAERIISALQEWIKISTGNWEVKELNGKILR